MSASQRWLPFYLMLALIWGCSFLFIEVGLESFTAAGVAFTRIAFGALVLIIISITLSHPSDHCPGGRIYGFKGFPIDRSMPGAAIIKFRLRNERSRRGMMGNHGNTPVMN